MPHGIFSPLGGIALDSYTRVVTTLRNFNLIRTTGNSAKKNLALQGRGIQLARDNSISIMTQSGQELLRIYTALIKCSLE